MLKSPGNNFFMSHYELYELLAKYGTGIDARAKRLPRHGFDVTVQGVRFMCDPASDMGRRSKHRLHYVCEPCLRLIPFGRAYQHNKGAPHKAAAAWQHNKAAAL